MFRWISPKFGISVIGSSLLAGVLSTAVLMSPSHVQADDLADILRHWGNGDIDGFNGGGPPPPPPPPPPPGDDVRDDYGIL